MSKTISRLVEKELERLHKPFPKVRDRELTTKEQVEYNELISDAKDYEIDGKKYPLLKRIRGWVLLKFYRKFHPTRKCKPSTYHRVCKSFDDAIEGNGK